MNWLCDTNIISELMKRTPDLKVWQWAKEQEHFHISVISVEEIYCGLEHRQLKKKRAWFERFLKSRCVTVAVGETIAARSGILRGAFLSKGVSRSQADLLIAASAWKCDATLVTRNTGDFEGCGVPLLNPFA